jgi:putative transposase
VLRHELAVLRRQTARPPLTTAARVFPAAASRLLPRSIWTMFVVKPATLLDWHRRLVARRCTYRRRAGRRADQSRGSPADPADGARESAMGLSAHRRRTERTGRGRVGNGSPEHSTRGKFGSGGWTARPIVGSIPAVASEESHRRRFLYRRHDLSAPLYVLFFIEVATRRVHFVVCTARPDDVWVTQQARQLTWTLAERSEPVRLLVRERSQIYAKLR